MSATVLTRNFLPLVFSPEDNPDADSPVLQLLAIEKKRIVYDTSDGSRSGCRVLVSDGEYHCQAILAEYLYFLFEESGLEKFVVIALTDFKVTEDVLDQRVLLINDLDVVPHPRVQIGDPTINIEAVLAKKAAGANAKLKPKRKSNPAIRLTRGFIKRAWGDQGSPDGAQPVLQCVSAQKFIMSGHHALASHTLYALELSDGIHTCPAMLSGPMYALFECKEIGPNSMFRVTRFTVRGDTERKMMLISAGYPVFYNGGKIGKPIDIQKPPEVPAM